ncbi:MAG TPA: hypothetical protein VHD55_03155 [Candidatus Paceibacterota bacterium]|nr:hypothetical protein [Candidatus Paceibacterota bacterium]
MDRSAWVAITIGSSAGGLLPMLWGGGIFASTFFGAAGAFAAVWFNFKMNH